MNGELNQVNIEALQKSLETISSLDNNINNVNLSKYFTEIETKIRQINFEHANCISNYKDSMNSIYEKIDEIKENIHQLSESLKATIHGFSTTDVNYRIENNSLSNLKTSITQVPPVTQDNPEIISSEPMETQETINTVPIGLGIAATGIAGSIGAIVVDSMNDHKKVEIEEYRPTKEEFTTPVVEETQKEMNPIPTFDSNSPYHASRNSEAMNKFYGTNITEYYEKEDSEEKSDY